MVRWGKLKSSVDLQPSLPTRGVARGVAPGTQGNQLRSSRLEAALRELA